LPSGPMPKKVAFLCWGNACRSIMAEALARHFYRDLLSPCSAGISPLGHIPRETLQVLGEMGVSGEGLRSKCITEIDLGHCALLVNLLEDTLEGLGLPAGGPPVIHRPVPDPYGGGLEVYRQTRDAIRALLSIELAGWLT
jgi:arsenate reductase (thioredoxin)